MKKAISDSSSLSVKVIDSDQTCCKGITFEPMFIHKNRLEFLNTLYILYIIYVTCIVELFDLAQY